MWISTGLFILLNEILGVDSDDEETDERTRLHQHGLRGRSPVEVAARHHGAPKR